MLHRHHDHRVNVVWRGLTIWHTQWVDHVELLCRSTQLGMDTMGELFFANPSSTLALYSPYWTFIHSRGGPVKGFYFGGLKYNIYSLARGSLVFKCQTYSFMHLLMISRDWYFPPEPASVNLYNDFQPDSNGNRIVRILLRCFSAPGCVDAIDFHLPLALFIDIHAAGRLA